MKLLFVVALLVAAVAAAPSTVDGQAKIVIQSLDNIGTDGYSSSYKTENGISASEQGALKNVGTENEGMEVVGEFEYPGPDGVLYRVTYTAGAAGFLPQGAHIPV